MPKTNGPEGISDPILNCVLEVCCGRVSSEASLAGAMLSEGVCEDEKHAKKCAAWIREYFDLAPAGTLTELKQVIARLARGQQG